VTIEPSALLFAACLLLFASGCPSAAQQAGIYLEQSGMPPELKQDFECFAVNCSKCHGLSRALNASIVSTEHWDRYVARMARNPGSGISPAEAPSILRFLHWHTRQRTQRMAEASSPPSAPAAPPMPAVSEVKP
jgi:hypothetical protein